MESLAERITLRRRKLRMTKQDLAKKAEISVQQLSNIENGQNTSVQTLNKILLVLGLELDMKEKADNNLNY